MKIDLNNLKEVYGDEILEIINGNMEIIDSNVKKCIYVTHIFTYKDIVFTFLQIFIRSIFKSLKWLFFINIYFFIKI